MGGKMVYIRKKKTKPGNNGWWSEKKKVECITAYLTLGNLQQVSAMTNVPVGTLRQWKRADWWTEIVQNIQDEDSQELDAKLRKVVDKTLQVIEDRLDNGDVIYDSKVGEVRRVPAKLRDAVSAANTLIDKRHAIKKNTVQQKTDAVGVNDRLLNLAEQFAKFALGKQAEEKIVNEYIEGEYEDAVHVERET